MAILHVRPEQGRKPMNPRMWGLSCADIGSAGGGLCAEMARNHAFADGCPPAGAALPTDAPGWESWHSQGARSMARLCREGGRHPGAPAYLSWDIGALPTGADCALINQGYGGMSIQAGRRYRYQIIARCADGYRGGLNVALLSGSGARLAEDGTDALSPVWTAYSGTLVCPKGDERARLALLARDTGRVEVDAVSLLPQDAVCGVFQPGPVAMLRELRPGFLRFPVGCAAEGASENAPDWRRALGPIENRLSQPTGSGHAWLGLHEYLLLCEQLGASAMFEFMPCQGPQGADAVRSAIDAVTYALGPIATPYGAMRAAAGHPAPFDLRYLAVDNGGQDGEKLCQALADGFPQLSLISNRIPGAPIQVLDERVPIQPGDLPALAHRYDGYDRQGPRIHVRGSVCGADTLDGMLGEAAFRIGLENNCDVVVLASCAPTAAPAPERQGAAGRMAFVQRLFAQNQPEMVVSCDLEGLPSRTPLAATAGERGGELLVKAVNGSPEPVQVDLDVPGCYRSGQVLCGAPGNAGDGLGSGRIAPAPRPDGRTYSFAPRSLTVLRFG